MQRQTPCLPLHHPSLIVAGFCWVAWLCLRVPWGQAVGKQSYLGRAFSSQKYHHATKLLDSQQPQVRWQPINWARENKQQEKKKKKQMVAISCNYLPPSRRVLTQLPRGKLRMEPDKLLTGAVTGWTGFICLRNNAFYQVVFQLVDTFFKHFFKKHFLFWTP